LEGTSIANFDKLDLAPDAAVRDAAAVLCAGPSRPLPFGVPLVDCRNGKPGSADLGGAVPLFGAKRVASNAFAIALF